MGYAKYTEEQREWLLRRWEYCLAKIYPRAQPEKLDISEGRCTLKRMGILYVR
ncbi:PerC family transcriptional regulator [Escherichia coli]|uniref:PerC family transcriptional regulator n=1 Tax=Escherichia coli TaxID=562 RepID=UPI002028A92A|nr:PerC family transcriptional regulator [Escherichia coli]